MSSVKFACEFSHKSQDLIPSKSFKIDVSCEASVNFQEMSQSLTPATTFAAFAPCHRWMQHCQCAKTPQHHASKVLHLVTRSDLRHSPTSQDVTKSATPATQIIRKFTSFQTSKSDNLCSNRQRYGHMVPHCKRLRQFLGMVANNKSKLERRHPPPEINESPSLRMREKTSYLGAYSMFKGGGPMNQWTTNKIEHWILLLPWHTNHQRCSSISNTLKVV